MKYFYCLSIAALVASADAFANRPLGVKRTFALNVVPEEPKPLSSMLDVSQLVYQYVNIRDVIRKHELTVNGNSEKSEEMKAKIPIIEFDSPGLVVTENGSVEGDIFEHNKLNYPITPSMILEFIQKNRGYLKLDDGGNMEFDETGSNTQMFPCESILKGLKENFDADIVEYDDFKVNDEGLASELLYTVIVNRSDKRITVCFRGSVTKKDFLIDAGLRRRRPEEEFANLRGKDIRIHRGFYNYLFRDNQDRGGISKFDQICALLKELYEYKDEAKGRDYSDYSLFVTGHSLGGALAQLFAFVLAGTKVGDDFLPKGKPVVAVTYASPEVGNDGYEKEFNLLEKADKLRHLRVSNKGDLVPCGFSIAAPLMGYKQPGVNVHVSDNKEVDVGYNRIFRALSRKNPIAMHNLNVYRERLFHEKNAGIESKTVEDFYTEKRVKLAAEKK